MYSVFMDGELLYATGTDDRDAGILSPTVTQELNKAGTMSFTILPNHPLYDAINRMTSYVQVYQDNEELFAGRVLEVSTDIYRQRTVTCEGSLAYLLDSIVETGTVEATADAYFRALIDKHNEQVCWTETLEDGTEILHDEKKFTVGAVTIKDYEYKKDADGKTVTPLEFIYETDSAGNLVYETDADGNPLYYQTDLEGKVLYDDSGEPIPKPKTKTRTFIVTQDDTLKSEIDDNLLSEIGGYVRTRYALDEETGKYINYIDYLNDFGELSDQNIEFGVNMLSMTETVKSSDIFTVLKPLASSDEKGTIDAQFKQYNGGSAFIEIAPAVKKYGRIIRSVSFSDVKTGLELLEQAQIYVEDNYRDLPSEFSFTAIDLKLLGYTDTYLTAGKKVGIYSEPHGIQQAKVCTGATFNLDNPDKNTYAFGDDTRTKTRRKAITSSSSGGGGGGSGSKKSGSTLTDDIKDSLLEERKKLIKLWVGDGVVKIDTDGITLSKGSTDNKLVQMKLMSDGTLKIDANCVDLGKYATVTSLNAATAKIDKLDATVISAEYINNIMSRQANAVIGDLRVAGNLILSPVAQAYIKSIIQTS